jgi:hypothetical protein
VRILFSVRKPSNVRHYESVLRQLSARGHDVDLVTESIGLYDWPPFVHALADSCPRIRLETLPSTISDPMWELATEFRRARFYLRFFRTEYRAAPALLGRARNRARDWAVRLADRIGQPGRVALIAVLDLLEQSTRTATIFHSYLREKRPDLIVLTPLVVLKTAQLDLGRAAIELGIRNVFAVASWDHLSSKGELNFTPQRVLVWNDIQKREAVELHGLPSDRVFVTGSQVFDDWFGREPSTTREEFCHRVGLRADRPVVLYVGSSLLEASPAEPPFVARWVRHLRASGHPVLRDCGILIRPHHEHGPAWSRLDLSGLDQVACWPRLGASPVDARSKNDYFDSLFHSTAVVGLNTSAMIEAAVLGRPVHTVLLPEFHDNQEGTVHFHYLLSGPDALLRATRSLDDHARDVAQVLEGRDPDPDRSARFVRSFVRPRGLDTAATAHVVGALEELAAQPAPAPLPVPLATRLVRPIVRPFLQRYADAAAERARLRLQASLRRSEQRLEDHRARKAPALEAHRLRKRETARASRGNTAAALPGPPDRP